MPGQLEQRVVGLVVLVAVALKMWFPASIAGVMLHYAPRLRDGGRLALPALIGALIAVEALVALMLIARPGRSAQGLGLGMLALFTAGLVGMAFDRAAPHCGCFGLRLFEQARAEAWFGVGRNLVLASLLAAPIVATWRAAAPSPGRAGARRGGFTVVELMVVAAVVAVLTAISLPALSGARQRAESTAGLARIQQCAASLGSYAADHRDAFPYLGATGSPEGPFVYRGWFAPLGVPYYRRAEKYWMTPMLDHGYLQPFPGIVRFDRDYPPEQFVRTDPAAPRVNPMAYASIFMSGTTASAPDAWVDEPRLDDPWWYRGQRHTDVRFTSRKGILLDLDLEHNSGDLSTVAGRLTRADGSAFVTPWLPLFQPALLLDRPGLGATPWPALCTRRGLAGRDW